MKNYDDFIRNSVFNVNQKYNDLQNKTKELFFKCLDEGSSLEYFEEQLDKIWGNVDRSFMEKDIEEYKSIIHNRNIAMLEISESEEPKKENEFFSLITLGVIIAIENKFKRQVKKDYKRSLKSYAYLSDKRDYLSKKAFTYKDDKVVPYRLKTGEIRHVSLAAYCAMLHNTNMTRAVWNTTLNDADRMRYSNFYIPYHAFSCPDCVAHQERRLTRSEVMDMVGEVEEKQGDILHPNCKCVLLIYDIAKKGTYDYLTDEEKDEIYHIRQKVNTLTLEKSRILTDMKIQKRLDKMEEFDKLNQKRNKVNAQIRELKNSLPTEELQKQVVAINR